jgi:hypothetical protein
MKAAMELPLNSKEGREGDMKKQTLKTFTMWSLLLMLTAVSVAAQSERSKITIPFSFIVGEKTLPAGEYTVEPNRRNSDRYWLVQNRDSRTSCLFTTMSVRANQTQEETKLVFHRYGDQYFLSQIWTPGANSGRELLMPGLERKLAKNAKIERQTIVQR